MSRRVVVVHFDPPNLDKRLARLSGDDVESLTPKGPADLKALRERPPDAFVIDLAAIDRTWSGPRFAR